MTRKDLLNENKDLKEDLSKRKNQILQLISDVAFLKDPAANENHYQKNFRAK